MNSEKDTDSEAAFPLMPTDIEIAKRYDPRMYKDKKDNSREDVFITNIKLDNINPVSWAASL